MYTGDRLRINIAKFVDESFHIEGISLNEDNRNKQTNILSAFLTSKLDVDSVERYVRKATGFKDSKVVLRNMQGMDVRVGNHFPPPGGPSIPEKLDILLHKVAKGGTSPWANHLEYENLHPFIDGNGRSGRAIWAWQMHNFHNYKFELTFLHYFYYQTLDNERNW